MGCIDVHRVKYIKQETYIETGVYLEDCDEALKEEASCIFSQARESTDGQTYTLQGYPPVVFKIALIISPCFLNFGTFFLFKYTTGTTFVTNWSQEGQGSDRCVKV